MPKRGQHWMPFDNNGAYVPPTGMVGLDGRRYGPYAGIALETQSWPDAPNRPDFPSAILRPGETYRHDVRYVFRRATTRQRLTPLVASSARDKRTSAGESLGN